MVLHASLLEDVRVSEMRVARLTKEGSAVRMYTRPLSPMEIDLSQCTIASQGNLISQLLLLLS